MTAFSVAGNDHLLRSNVWSSQMKTLLEDELMGMRWVKILSEFPDGTTFNIPSVGEAETRDYSEGQAIRYDRMDTGNYTFSWDQYKYSANAVTEKFKRDSYYAEQVVSSFVPKQHRALMEAVETRILSRGNDNQTASSLNAINGADHRWVGSGTNETMAPVDFAKARYSLQKANITPTNLIAIVDPSVTYALQTSPNIMNALSPYQMSESIFKEGGTTGTRFRFNLFGFDIYESNYLKRDISETVDGLTVTVGVSNLLFSATPGDTLPIIGGFKQMPTVYSEFNKDLQQTEYLTICEYGFKLYRPENMVVVLSDTDQV